MNKKGQALIEFVVVLVAVLALTAGLLQVASLSRVQTETMVEARREAGELAMLDVDTLSAPEYIRDWEEGPDGARHTADDRFSPGDPAAFTRTVVDRAVAVNSDWEIIEAMPDSDFQDLAGTAWPVAEFGLVRGYDSRTVPLLPAVQSLLYRATGINIESEVWMTRTTGMY
ncbi:MAG: hypothetical protein HQ559_12695 [Lentisphaerae bacterium]|nr:hypothetical protein [Lentisphaerota bacterium]